jgi:hypothetical protein
MHNRGSPRSTDELLALSLIEKLSTEITQVRRPTEAANEPRAVSRATESAIL